nr:reverse transcriptase domain-containing protein [Tanacetum cinerariifolium]
MPFGLCNVPATFQRCMTVIFYDMVEDFMEVFMDDFLVFGNSFNYCLANLDRMLAKCEEINLVLNWRKCNFMVKEGIVLGHKISGADNLSRLENPDLGTLTEDEITDEFLDEHLMILKAKLDDDGPWYADYVNYIVGFENDDSKEEIDAVDELHVDNSISNSENELSDNEASDFDNPLIPRPPSEPPDAEFDSGE